MRTQLQIGADLMEDEEQWITDFVTTATKDQLIKLLELLNKDEFNTKLKNHLNVKINEFP